MSVRVMVTVFAAPIRPAGRKLVALALANAAADDGTRIFPGEDRLLRETTLSAPSVRRHVADLITAGVLVEVRAAHSGVRREFRIDLEELEEAIKDERLRGLKDERQCPPNGTHPRAERRSSTDAQALTGERPYVLPRPHTSSKTDARSRRARAPMSYPSDFEEFWIAYDYKVGKARALRAWRKAIAEGAEPDEVVAGARRYRAWIDEQADPPHRKYPEGWLSARRWEDELPSTDSRDWIAEDLRRGGLHVIEDPRGEGP